MRAEGPLSPQDAENITVVGDLIGSGASQEQAIVGETPNLAARLQSIAEPNSVVVAESTRKLVGSLFEVQDLGAQDLKGIARPVQAWAALRPSSVESRFDALHATGLTELVGREEELELLLRRWSKAKIGEGQMVLLSGEPGIGKSRLTAALLERLASEPHTRLRYFCSPQHTDSALNPIISQMERAAGFAHEDDAEAKLDKLDAVLPQTFTPRQDAALLAEMLSLTNDGRYPTLQLEPQQRRQRTLEALTAQVEGLSRSNAVLIIFEDVHWIDPTSLEVLGQVVDRIGALAVLLIVTYRPEFEPPWIGRPDATALTLNRLGKREIGAMIDGVTGNKPLPTRIRHDIIERTDGIPLFVEEITKAVLEAEIEAATERAVAAIPSPSVAVPASLHASLMARLDRLGTAKEVAQIGAGIGREFSHALLSAVARKPEAELNSALDRLLAAGLLFRQGMPPQESYLFKHALVQDAAYGTLLRERRRALHARIAETLESQFPEIAQTQPELLARHCTEAGQIEKSALLWGNAGERSVERSALVEAVELLTRALDQIGTLPSSPSLRGEQIKLQVALISPLIHVKGYAAPETKAATEDARLLMEQAEKLGEATEDPLLLFAVLYGFSIVNYLKFDGEAFRASASEFLALAQKHGATVPLVTGHRLLGHALLLTGDIAGARAHYTKSLALYDPAEHRTLAMRIGGQDAEMSAVTHRGRTLWLLGYPTAALADAERGVAVAREVGHAVNLMYALILAAFIQINCGRLQSAGDMVDEALALAEEKNSANWKTAGQLARGWIFSLSDNSLDAVRTLASGLSANRLSGATVWRPFFLSYEARALSQLGQIGEAWQRVDEAMITIETVKERVWEAEVHRIAGEIALASPEADAVKAEAYFDHALTVVRQQQAKAWELRTAMSLARLWRDQGKVQQARDLLAPVYGWFTEGFDTRDLKEAKAQLEELAA